MKRALALLLALISGFGCQAQDAWTPERLHQEVSSKGARTVVAELTRNDEKDWNVVLAKVESGNAAWLRVAAELRKGTDAGGTEDLDFSVARALPKAPVSVLKLVGQGFTIKEVCTSPFIESQPGIEERYLLQTQQALARLHVEDVETSRRSCLAAISQIIADAKRSGRWK
jgi:hypothetical protein